MRKGVRARTARLFAGCALARRSFRPRHEGGAAHDASHLRSHAAHTNGLMEMEEASSELVDWRPPGRAPADDGGFAEVEVRCAWAQSARSHGAVQVGADHGRHGCAAAPNGSWWRSRGRTPHLAKARQKPLKTAKSRRAWDRGAAFLSKGAGDAASRTFPPAQPRKARTARGHAGRESKAPVLLSQTYGARPAVAREERLKDQLRGQAQPTGFPASALEMAKTYQAAVRRYGSARGPLEKDTHTELPELELQPPTPVPSSPSPSVSPLPVAAASSEDVSGSAVLLDTETCGVQLGEEAPPPNGAPCTPAVAPEPVVLDSAFLTAAASGTGAQTQQAIKTRYQFIQDLMHAQDRTPTPTPTLSPARSDGSPEPAFLVLPGPPPRPPASAASSRSRNLFERKRTRFLQQHNPPPATPLYMPPGSVFLRRLSSSPSEEISEHAAATQRMQATYYRHAVVLQVFIRAAWCQRQVVPRVRALRLCERLRRFSAALRARVELRRRAAAVKAAEEVRVEEEGIAKEEALRALFELWERRIRATVYIQRMIKKVHARRAKKRQQEAVRLIERFWVRNQWGKKLLLTVKAAIRQLRSDQLERFAAAHFTRALIARRLRRAHNARTLMERNAVAAVHVLCRVLQRYAAVRRLARLREQNRAEIEARVEMEHELYSTADYLAVHRVVQRCEGYAALMHRRRAWRAAVEARVAAERVLDGAAMVVQAFAACRMMDLNAARRVFLLRFGEETLRIQAALRGFFGRRAKARRLQGLLDHEDERVAKERQYHTQECLRLAPVILKIQSVARSALTRMRLRRRGIVPGGSGGQYNAAKRAFLERCHMTAEDWSDHEQFACIIQRAFRSRMARVRLESHRRRFIAVASRRINRERGNAAHSIQCLWRRWWEWCEVFGAAAMLIAPWWRWRSRCMYRRRARAAHVIYRAMMRGTALSIKRRAVARIECAWIRACRRQSRLRAVRRWLLTADALEEAAAMKIQKFWRTLGVPINESYARSAIIAERTAAVAAVVYQLNALTAGVVLGAVAAHGLAQEWLHGASGLWEDEAAARAAVCAARASDHRVAKHEAALRRLAMLKHKQAKRIPKDGVVVAGAPQKEWRARLAEHLTGQSPAELDHILWHVPSVPVRLVEEARRRADSTASQRLLLTPAPPQTSTEPLRIEPTPTPTIPTPVPPQRRPGRGARMPQLRIGATPKPRAAPRCRSACAARVKAPPGRRTPRLYVPEGRAEYISGTPDDLRRYWDSASDSDEEAPRRPRARTPAV